MGGGGDKGTDAGTGADKGTGTGAGADKGTGAGAGTAAPTGAPTAAPTKAPTAAPTAAPTPAPAPSMPAPNTSTSACDGPKVNVVEELSEFAGDWGGSCTCPDGQIYEVGDNNWKGCGQIACVGGVAGKCSEFKGPWSRRRVFCAPCPEEVKPQPPAVTAPAPKEDDRGLCTDVDTTVGIAARSSFGGFCCKFCQGGKSICCPSKDSETGEDVRASKEGGGWRVEGGGRRVEGVLGSGHLSPLGRGPRSP